MENKANETMPKEHPFTMEQLETFLTETVDFWEKKSMADNRFMDSLLASTLEGRDKGKCLVDVLTYLRRRNLEEKEFYQRMKELLLERNC